MESASRQIISTDVFWPWISRAWAVRYKSAGIIQSSKGILRGEIGVSKSAVAALNSSTASSRMRGVRESVLVGPSPVNIKALARL